MHVILVRNVNDAYVDGLWCLKVNGIEEETRNGPVVAANAPVCTIYKNPMERVLFDEERNANPFFHLYECVWMLAGSNAVEPLAYYNKKMKEFSDDRMIFHGAYGHRWRKHFGLDQLEEIILVLKSEKYTRRAVLAMWDPVADLGSKGKDIPCNTHIYFRVMPGDRLDMTVCCRSNDVIWGAYGTNAVHFSYLQEFIAGAAGLLVGRLYQISNNFHIYKNLLNYEEIMKFPALDINPYNGRVEPYPLGVTMNNWRQVLDDYKYLVNGNPPKHYCTQHGERVLRWMTNLWAEHKGGYPHSKSSALPRVDWHAAALQWLDRRMQAKLGVDPA
jgi:thymidylate synthase